MASLIDHLSLHTLDDMQICDDFTLINLARRTHPDGRCFLVLHIQNKEGRQGQAVLWSDAVTASNLINLNLGREYLITLQQAYDPPFEHVYDDWRPYIEVVDIVPSKETHALNINWSKLPKLELVKQLQFWMDTCPVPELAHFVSQVFNDRELTIAFFTRPASERHHHAWPGGLAEHSLEVASRVETMLVHATDQERWLASAAGLLHDLGKIRTHQNDGRRTATGYVMQHEDLTLELLAPALKLLDKSWADGANALRYLLVGMTKAAAEKRPWLPSLMIVQVADRLSAAEDTRRQAFVNRPDWQRFATLDVPGSPSRFWMPKAPPSSARNNAY